MLSCLKVTSYKCVIYVFNDVPNQKFPVFSFNKYEFVNKNLIFYLNVNIKMSKNETERRHSVESQH